MAAVDTFRTFNASLSSRERALFIELIKQTSEELLAARSEDARLRIVNGYLEEFHDRAEAYQ